MENKTAVSTVFGLAMIGVLAVSLVVLSSANNHELELQKNNQNVLGFAIQRKNAKINALSAEVAAKQKELDTVKQSLQSVKNDLDVLHSKVSAVTTVPEVAVAQ